MPPHWTMDGAINHKPHQSSPSQCSYITKQSPRNGGILSCNTFLPSFIHTTKSPWTWVHQQLPRPHSTKSQKVPAPISGNGQRTYGPNKGQSKQYSASAHSSRRTGWIRKDILPTTTAQRTENQLLLRLLFQSLWTNKPNILQSNQYCQWQHR